MRLGGSFFDVVVVVRAVGFCALVPVSAVVELVVVRVVLLFFPSVTVRALVLVGAPVLVGTYVLSRSPVWTLLFGVLIKLGLSPIVLPVVGKHTDIPLVLSFIVRTPHRLKVEQVKVNIFVELINQLH